MREESEKVQKKRREGFTLVEMICVIALMSILMATAVPSYKNIQDKAAKRVAVSNAQAAYTAAAADRALYLEDEETEEEQDGVTILEGKDGVVEGAVWEGIIYGKRYKATYRAGENPSVEVLEQ